MQSVRTHALAQWRSKKTSAIRHRLVGTRASAAGSCIIVGAGVVGLAVARSLARAGEQVILLEKGSTWGSETSSRHSEVIHAGLHYTPGSLKSQLCVQGKLMLYDYLAAHGVTHRRISKLIVATSERQHAALLALKQGAPANGVYDLQILSGQEATELEPQLHATMALLSPSTGIFDSQGYMQALLTDAQQAGAILRCNAEVVGGQGRAGGGMQLEVLDRQSGERSQLNATRVVNAAGLWAQQISRLIGLPASVIPKLHLAKGNYFMLASSPPPFSPPTSTTTTQSSSFTLSSITQQGSAQVQPLQQAQSPQASTSATTATPTIETGSPTHNMHSPCLSSLPAPFSRLIYPLPQDGGLGVHLTLDMAGRTRFGPDVEWVDHIDYKVDPTRAQSIFQAAVRQYYPALPDHALQPAYAGVRPKLTGPGHPAADFCIQGADHSPRGFPQLPGHGVCGLICLYGMESPGLTSSLAVADYVTSQLLGHKQQVVEPTGQTHGVTRPGLALNAD